MRGSVSFLFCAFQQKNQHQSYQVPQDKTKLLAMARTFKDALRVIQGLIGSTEFASADRVVKHWLVGSWSGVSAQEEAIVRHALKLGVHTSLVHPHVAQLLLDGAEEAERDRKLESAALLSQLPAGDS